MFKTRTMSYNLSMLWQSTKEMEWPLGWVAALVTLLLAILKIRPKVKQGPTKLRYIDYAENKLIEENEYMISWGHIFPKKISLPKIHRDSEFQLFYKPQTSYKKELPKDCYEEKRKGSMWGITLINKQIFDEAETDRVYIETKTYMKDEGYKKNINNKILPDCIQITNETREEIHNYPILLPPNIDISQLDITMGYLSWFETPSEDSKGITIKIRNISANYGNNPEILMVPIRRA